MAKESAEQKLLKLIEQTNAQQPPPTGTAAVSAPAPAEEAQKALQSVSSVGVSGISMPPGMMGIANIFRGFFPQGQGFGLRQFNQIFIVVIVIFGIFFVTDLMQGMERSKVTLKKVFGENISRNWGTQGAVWNSETKAFADYAQIFAKRNIFQPFEEKVAKKAEKTEEQKSGIALIADQVKDLKLVGISWLETPESASAMIENINSGTTYFLSVGDRIQNVTVKKIYADSIVVGFGQEEMELKL